ncbi:MAG: AMP-binding protein [Gemmataceae bacterium]|nr:AMP-binding protein [Gemmataceae bacterium]
MTVPFLHALQATIDDRSACPAVAHRDRSYSYGLLDGLARSGAFYLQSLGVEKGDRVVLLTSDKLAFLVAHLATLYAGAVSLPLNPRFTAEELRFFLKDSGARVVVVANEQIALVEALRQELPDLRALVRDKEMLEEHSGALREPDIAAQDPCLLLYSSGTTGWPKGVVHTHASVASSLQALQACWRFTPDDVVLNVLPLFHIHGLSFATQLTLLSGGCVVLDEFEPQATWRRLNSCTVFMAVPTIYYRFLEESGFRAAARAWQRVRLYTCGSAPIRPEVLPELETILERHVINRYGMTEAFVITSLPLDGPWPAGSVGLPLAGVEVRVAASPGEVGAVELRGPNLFREYWRQPEATKSAFASGWFDTGDLGFLTPLTPTLSPPRGEGTFSGFLTLVGRKNDLIITSGFNVYPQVVERVINSCPGVRESAVLGIPDKRKGERVAAVVVRDDPALDEQQLRAFWNSRLVDYQRPKDVVFVDALPRNALGKVLRRELREQIEKQG